METALWSACLSLWFSRGFLYLMFLIGLRKNLWTWQFKCNSVWGSIQTVPVGNRRTTLVNSDTNTLRPQNELVIWYKRVSLSASIHLDVILGSFWTFIWHTDTQSISEDRVSAVWLLVLFPLSLCCSVFYCCPDSTVYHQTPPTPLSFSFPLPFAFRKTTHRVRRGQTSL